MPELPDVEILKQYADASCLHQKIVQVEVKDDAVLSISPQTLKKHVESHSFEETNRRGKHLFMATEDEKWLMLHFGMTGKLQYGKDESALPDHTRVLFRFENGSHLAYDCQRKLGKIDTVETPDQFCEKHEIGPDALDINLKKFRQIISKKRGMIKSALMDQSAIAGLGNVYSDELLYQCKIHPKTKAGNLSDDQVKKLHRSMQRILKTAINNQAKPKEMPDHYLIAHRQEGADCPDCVGSIERIKVSGRGCYICPECQHL